MYYAGSLSAVRTEIERRYPGTKPELMELSEGEPVHPAYLLWMCEQVQNMDTSSIEAALKAARWIGWIFAHVEMLGLWNNTHTRDITREDVQQGLDRPHPS